MANADFQRVVPEKLYSAIADAFFYGFHIVSKDLTMSSALFIVGVAIQFVQMLYFPVALLLNAGRFGEILSTILRITALIRIDTDVGETGMMVIAILVSAACTAGATGIPRSRRILPPGSFLDKLYVHQFVLCWLCVPVSH